MLPRPSLTSEPLKGGNSGALNQWLARDTSPGAAALALLLGPLKLALQLCPEIQRWLLVPLLQQGMAWTRQGCFSLRLVICAPLTIPSGETQALLKLQCLVPGVICSHNSSAFITAE